MKDTVNNISKFLEDADKYPRPGEYTRKALHDWSHTPEIQWNVNEVYVCQDVTVHIERISQFRPRDPDAEDAFWDQIFILDGFRITLWLGENQLTFAIDDESSPNIVEHVMRESQKLRNVCQHISRVELSQAECNSRRIYHWGMFCHVYECSTCGEIRTVDSSG